MSILLFGSTIVGDLNLKKSNQVKKETDNNKLKYRNMPTIQEVQAQIKNLDGFESFLGGREIKELPNILWDDEVVENIIQGIYNNGNGVLVATNRRLVFVHKGLLFGLKVEDFPYDKISSIQYDTGILFGKLTIFTSGNKAIIDQVLKSKVRVFGDWVRARISSPQQNAIKQPIQPQATTDIVTQLEKLAKLKEQGILSEEEFAVQKKIILDQKH